MKTKRTQKNKKIRRMRTYGRYLKKSIFATKNVFVLVVVIGCFSFILTSVNTKKQLHTADLLTAIAQVESNDNYNAYFGNAKNTAILFTAMPIKDVLAWQADFVAQGNVSSAVGRYQFIDSTLQGLIAEKNIDQNVLFDKPLQDRLADALLERRGLQQYVDQQISKETFAHNLSKEWAALPKVIGDNPQQSYYESDGVNQARLSIDQIYSGIATIRKL